MTAPIESALAATGLDLPFDPMRVFADTMWRALSATGLIAASAAGGATGAPVDAVGDEAAEPSSAVDRAQIGIVRGSEQPSPGEFASRSFTNDAGTRSYKLYIPGSYEASNDPLPMIVMLHACSQSPDDFAAGTRMNELAEQHGFLVVYPEQASNANGSKCWNWFRSQDQMRDGGEPSLIAGITREVEANYRVDKGRIFVAGLSAGASMAVILGATYPELYAAIGAHSGLPYGAAHDMLSAFAAMQGHTSLSELPNTSGIAADDAAAVSLRSGGARLPAAIVFHGDHDRTINVKNGAFIVEQMVIGRPGGSSPRTSTHEGAAPGGRVFTHTVYTDAAGHSVGEHWVLHGAEHAWSGGSSAGSFTDTEGPNASEEMVRFFHSLGRAKRASHERRPSWYESARLAFAA